MQDPFTQGGVVPIWIAARQTKQPETAAKRGTKLKYTTGKESAQEFGFTKQE